MPITVDQALRRTGPDPSMRRFGLRLSRRDAVSDPRYYDIGPKSSKSTLVRAGDELDYGTNFVTPCGPQRESIRLP